MYLGDQVLGHNPLFETQSAHFPATTKVIKLDLLKKKSITNFRTGSLWASLSDSRQPVKNLDSPCTLWTPHDLTSKRIFKKKHPPHTHPSSIQHTGSLQKVLTLQMGLKKRAIHHLGLFLWCFQGDVLKICPPEKSSLKYQLICLSTGVSLKRSVQIHVYSTIYVI